MAGTSWIYLLMVTLLLTSFCIKCEEDKLEEEEEVELPEPSKSGERTFNDKLSEDLNNHLNLLRQKVKTGDFGETNDVLDLTHLNFDSMIKKHKIMLILFYIPWCADCKDILITLENIAKVLKESDPPVPVAKVDCMTQEIIGKRYKLEEFPTLKVFRNGEGEDYDGPPIKKDIIKFMKEISAYDYVPPPEAVITLTQDNFTEVTNKEELMLVEFYSAMCEYCKTLAPQLEKAAQKLKERKPPIIIAKVDGIVETELVQEHNLTSYPQLFIFKKGKKSAYNGSRHNRGIQDYMISHEGIASTLYTKFTDVKNFMTGDVVQPVILGVFDDKNDPLMKLYNDANDEVRDEYEFGHTFSKEAKKMFGLTKGSAIVVVHPEYLISKYEKKYQFYTDPSGTVSDVQTFYKKYEVPLVGQLLAHTLKKKFTRRPLVIVFYDVDFRPKTRSLTQFWWNKVVEVARNYPDILFAVAKEDRFKEMLEEFGLIESGESVNVVMYDELERKYAMVDEEFSEESLTEFIEKYKKGKLRPIVKSQPAELKDLMRKPGEVQVVVGTTFDDIVLDETKEVFIEIYSRKCEICRMIEKDIVKLAKELTNETDIVIAKIDGSANDVHPHYETDRFPAIYYASPGKKNEPVLMDLTVAPPHYESLKTFVTDNSDILMKKGIAEISLKEEL